MRPKKYPDEQPEQPPAQIRNLMHEAQIFARVRLKVIRESQPDTWNALEKIKLAMRVGDFIPDMVCGASIDQFALTNGDRLYLTTLEFGTMEEALETLVRLGFRKENLRIEEADELGPKRVVFKKGIVLTVVYSRLEGSEKIRLSLLAIDQLARGNI